MINLGHLISCGRLEVRRTNLYIIGQGTHHRQEVTEAGSSVTLCFDAQHTSNTNSSHFCIISNYTNIHHIIGNFRIVNPQRCGECCQE